MTVIHTLAAYRTAVVVNVIRCVCEGGGGASR